MEAVNAVKYSQGSRIEIQLASDKDGVSLTVQNDEIGLVRSPKDHKRMGLAIMNQRASLMGTKLEIQRATGGGTLVMCAVKNPKWEDS